MGNKLYCSDECKRVANLERTKQRYYQKKEEWLIYGNQWRSRNPDYMKNYKINLKNNNPKLVKMYRINNLFGISLELYEQLTKKCMIRGCDFSLTVDVHHIDRNNQNNNPPNLVGLCPSHHQLIHRLNYRLILKSDGWALEP